MTPNQEKLAEAEASLKRLVAAGQNPHGMSFIDAMENVTQQRSLEAQIVVLRGLVVAEQIERGE
jgi:hypothetical protein